MRDFLEEIDTSNLDTFQVGVNGEESLGDVVVKVVTEHNVHEADVVHSIEVAGKAMFIGEVFVEENDSLSALPKFCLPSSAVQDCYAEMKTDELSNEKGVGF